MAKTVIYGKNLNWFSESVNWIELKTHMEREQDNSSTRQLIDTAFWRQFIDTIEDNSSTLFEDNSSTHYYLAIIPKLIK